MKTLQSDILRIVYSKDDRFTLEDVLLELHRIREHLSVKNDRVKRVLNSLRDRGYISQCGSYYLVAVRDF